ncbi:MAG: hypothetical protein STSR0008_10070 [Ignavibacterium sp.]
MVKLVMKHQIKSLYEIINSEPEFRKVKLLMNETMVIEKFYEIFPNYEKIAVPIKVKKKILTLKVENPVWRNELFFQKELLVKKINNFFDDKRINQIIFLG